MKKTDMKAPRLWLVIAKSYRALSLLAEQSIANTGLCLTDFAALEALLHKGPLTISEIQDKVRLASGSMTAAVDRLEKLAGPSHQWEENSKNSSRGARRREAGQTQVLEPRAKALCRGEGTNLWQSSR